MEILEHFVNPSEPARRIVAPRPRRRVADAPPAPADPAPWVTLFDGRRLEAPDLAALMRLAQRRTAAAGDVVLNGDRPARSLVALMSGDVVLGSRAADGSLRTERSVTGPAWLDLSAAWLSGGYEMEALALSDVVVAELPMDALTLELQARPSLALHLCAGLARRIHELTTASRNLLHNDAPARFALWLLERSPAEEGAVELKLQERKRDIAQQLAMTPETLSRLMRTLESKGVVQVQGYVVRIPDLGRLRQVAQGEEP